MQASLREYVSEVISHWWAAVTGFLMVLIGGGLDIAQTTELVLFDAPPPLVWRILWIAGLFLALLVAPFLAFHKVRLERDRAQDKLSDRKRLENALHQLALERRVGVGLRNTGMDLTPPETETAWWERVQAWLNTIESIMDAIHPADYNNWRTLGEVPLLTFGNHDQDMQRRLSMLTQWCDRLERYIGDRTKAG